MQPRIKINVGPVAQMSRARCLDASIPRSLRRAFTIVEIIVVVVIIGVLATLIAPRLIGKIGQTKTNVAKGNASTLANAFSAMSLDVGGVHSGWTIRAVWEKPSDIEGDAWKGGPYIQNEDQLKDPWGNEFVLVVPGRKNVDFDIVSYGADGKEGGEGENADVIAP
jgi:general secretion pathway protein G